MLQTQPRPQIPKKKKRTKRTKKLGVFYPAWRIDPSLYVIQHKGPEMSAGTQFRSCSYRVVGFFSSKKKEKQRIARKHGRRRRQRYIYLLLSPEVVFSLLLGEYAGRVAAAVRPEEPLLFDLQQARAKAWTLMRTRVRQEKKTPKKDTY